MPPLHVRQPLSEPAAAQDGEPWFGRSAGSLDPRFLGLTASQGLPRLCQELWPENAGGRNSRQHEVCADLPGRIDLRPLLLAVTRWASAKLGTAPPWSRWPSIGRAKLSLGLMIDAVGAALPSAVRLDARRRLFPALQSRVDWLLLGWRQGHYCCGLITHRASTVDAGNATPLRYAALRSRTFQYYGWPVHCSCTVDSEAHRGQ